MGFPARLHVGAVETLTLTSIAALAIVGASTVDMSNVDGELAAVFVLEAETSTITLSAVWQVSDDGTTWVRHKDENDVTPTVVGTGTGGDDAAVTVSIPAPRGVKCYRYARAGVLVGVTTGASGDLASVAYRYARPGF